MLPLSLLLLGSAAASRWNPDVSRSLFVTPSYPDDAPDCLRAEYHGVYGGDPSSQDHVFLPSTSCLMDNRDRLASSFFSENMIDGVEVMPDHGRYVWVGQAGVDHSISGHDQMSADEVIQYIIEQEMLILGGGPANADGPQMTLLLDEDERQMSGVAIIYVSETSFVLWVEEKLVPVVDSLLPPHLVPVALPPSPIMSVARNGWEPVPQHYLDHLANVTKHLKYDAKLDEILENELDVDSIRRNVRYLTGEGPSGIESRHSFTHGARKAAEWIKEKAEGTGAKCHFHSYLPGFSPNVICEYPHAKSVEGKVILSAHYDSRGSFGSTRAPGADDDGSGSAHLLEIASAIGSGGVRFKQPVVLAWFSGEEQGLYGSSYYAAKLKEDNETVILQIQADMLGYHAPGEPIQLALPATIHSPEASYLLGNLSSLYAPELVLGTTPACCSDHQSFHAIGYPATAVFERNGMIADPMYHNSGDLSSREGYDFEQIRSIAKVTMGAVLTVAGWTAEGK